MTGVRIRKISELSQHEIDELQNDFGFNLEGATHIAILRKDETVVSWNVAKEMI